MLLALFVALLLLATRGAVWPSLARNYYHWRLTQAVDETDLIQRCEQTLIGSNAGLRAVVDLLDNDHPTLSRAAMRALSIQVGQWNAAGDAASRQRQERLAEALHERLFALEGPARRQAAELAGAILLDLRAESEQWPTLVRACQQVIHDATPPGGLLLDREPALVASRAPQLAPQWLNESLYSSPPGGGIDQRQGAQVATADTAPRAPSESAHGFQQLRQPGSTIVSAAYDEASQEPPRPSEPVRAAADLLPGLAANQPAARGARTVTWLTSDDVAYAAQLDSAAGANREASLSDAATSRGESRPGAIPPQLRQLLNQVVSADKTVAAEAEVRLREQGFTHADLALAREVLPAEPTERVRLLRQILRRPGVSVNLWLLWYLDDDDARCRVAAIEMLATTSDQLGRAQVLRLAIEDPDATVRAAAARLAEPNGLRSAHSGPARVD